MPKSPNLAKQQTQANLQTHIKPTTQHKIINYNGFTTSFTVFQAIPILYAGFSLTAFQINLFTTFPHKKQITISISVVIVIIFAYIIWYWYKATSIDPTDEVQIMHRNYKERQQEFDTRKYKFFCRVCETFVGSHAHHCRKCNRCVHFFDHHCRWLNNCIGASNYIEFILLIFGCWIEEVFRISFSAYLFSQNIKDIQLGEVKINWIILLNAIMIFISLIPFFCLTFLCSLHVYLFCHKKATIDLIMQSRNANKIHPSLGKKNNNGIQMVAKQQKQALSQFSQNQYGRTPNQLLKQTIQDRPNLNLKNSSKKLPSLVLNKYNKPNLTDTNAKNQNRITINHIIVSQKL